MRLFFFLAFALAHVAIARTDPYHESRRYHLTQWRLTVKSGPASIVNHALTIWNGGGGHARIIFWPPEETNQLWEMRNSDKYGGYYLMRTVPPDQESPPFGVFEGPGPGMVSLTFYKNGPDYFTKFWEGELTVAGRYPEFKWCACPRDYREPPFYELWWYNPAINETMPSEIGGCEPMTIRSEFVWSPW
ncbi:hypothetical protein F5Y16DRAFT_48269 [Xylariaceae sp. FL0255]|nr:hypothetical protein F5Y16DRAFT_48269 [Xylariaceae sp. FL0255]